MQPKFEWILSVVFIALFLIVGAGLGVLAQFPVVSIALGLLCYGGLAYLLFSVWRDQKREKPRPQNAKRGFTRQSKQERT